MGTKRNFGGIMFASCLKANLLNIQRFVVVFRDCMIL